MEEASYPGKNAHDMPFISRGNLLMLKAFSAHLEVSLAMPPFDL
jgi:hypothetical protein